MRGLSLLPGLGGKSGGGGGGGLTLIQKQILAAPAATISFSAIPATYNALRLVIVGRDSTAADEQVTTKIQFNGDAAAHYDYLELYATAAPGSGALNAFAQTSLPAVLPAAGATAGLAGLVDLEIPAYAATTLQKVCRVLASFIDGVAGAAVANGNVINAACNWRSTAAVNAVLLTAGTNFVTGTSAYLYGY